MRLIRTNERIKKTIYIAMSGGVDSSVAAALLKKEGYRVVGVFFKPWQPTPPGLPLGGGAVGFCNWQQDRLDAMRVAAKLGIEFKTWDFSKQYGEKVTKYMVDGYRAGITPNPDVMCNKEIKFGLFLKKALAEGADFIATGHYAILKRKAQSLKLLKAKDTNKDQTYFLWTLTQEQLKYCLFPIGNYTKPEVRKLAKKFGLPNFAKKDSQGVCFVGELDMHDFLKEYIKSEVGEIRMLETGKIVGTHDGTAYYTIGQRHGLNITTGGGPYYVVEKDIAKNILYVSKIRMTNDEFLINEVNWINEQKKFPMKADVRIRYRSQLVSAVISIRHSSFVIRASRPLAAVASGQSAVIYSGQQVLGGGIFQSSP